MKHLLFMSLGGLAMIFVTSYQAKAANVHRGGGPPSPPASAYTACSGKSAGDSATDGNVSGTCEEGADGKLALRPSGPPPSGSTSESSSSQ